MIKGQVLALRGSLTDGSGPGAASLRAMESQVLQRRGGREAWGGVQERVSSGHAEGCTRTKGSVWRTEQLWEVSRRNPVDCTCFSLVLFPRTEPQVSSHLPARPSHAPVPPPALPESWTFLFSLLLTHFMRALPHPLKNNLRHN